MNGKNLWSLSDADLRIRLSREGLKQNYINILLDFRNEMLCVVTELEIKVASMQPRTTGLHELNTNAISDDELYPQIRDAVIKAQKASALFLQRKFGIGYARAARLLDELEIDGVVGPSGEDRREVLIKS